MERFPRPYQNRDRQFEPHHDFYWHVACFLHISGLSFLGNINTVLLTLIGSSLIIAGSCVINNFYDRDIDHLMERTKVRPTVTGKIQPSHRHCGRNFADCFRIIMLLMTTLMAAVSVLSASLRTLFCIQCGRNAAIRLIR
jgi:heme O synthase-like polyprenyltransferase